MANIFQATPKEYLRRIEEFSREKFWIVEIDLDYCSLDYGIGACTASIPATGEAKCYNTYFTCQDRENFDKASKTYRFCSKVSPLPSGLDAIPSIMAAPKLDAARIDYKGGIGIRGGGTISFYDHPHSDANIDKYSDERAYDPYSTGTFWGKLRARNPYYNNRQIRIYSGYLVDGQYDPLNFQTRHYVIEQITVNRGQASLKFRDILKLADNDRSQYPQPSSGTLANDISSGATSFDIEPAGAGDAYPDSGFVRISDEVMSYTRTGDTFNVSRGTVFTSASDHSENDTVQLAVRLNLRIDAILYELLTVGAKIDPSFIDQTAWDIEADDNYPYLLDAYITEPTGVKTLLQELGIEAPHVLWFDERTQLINFRAIKDPPLVANVLDTDKHIIQDSLKVTEKPDMRVSDVLVYFGRKDPTKGKDEINNYAQVYLRSDLSKSGEFEYGSQKIDTVFSRWLNNFNKTGAIELAARRGKRFAFTPRQVNLSLTAKDSLIWLGQNISVDHPVLQDVTGANEIPLFQVQSVSESGDRYNYELIEYPQVEALPDDPTPGIDQILISADVNNINLRTIYDSIFATPPDADTVIKFIVENGVVVGSTSNQTYSMDTGAWPAGAQVILIVNGVIAGKGGNSIHVENMEQWDGGHGLNLAHDLTVENISGLIGGGGGAGGYVTYSQPPNVRYAGGGGAGALVGTGHQNGTLTTGAPRNTFFESSPDPNPYWAGAGGDLGQNGESANQRNGWVFSPGDKGDAIHTNGHTLTIQNGNDNIIGAIV